MRIFNRPSSSWLSNGDQGESYFYAAVMENLDLLIVRMIQISMMLKRKEATVSAILGHSSDKVSETYKVKAEAFLEVGKKTMFLLHTKV